MDILTLTNTPLKKAWEVELREGSEDSKINGEGRTYTPLNIEGGSSHPGSQLLLLTITLLAGPVAY